MADSLSFVQGDERWQALRERARNDLFFFNAVILGFADKFPLNEETHRLLHLFLERKTGIPDIDEADRQLCMMPREIGKSSCGTVGHAVQLGCINPNVSILIVNEKEETARDFIKSIKWHFEANALLRALFPEVIPPDFAKTEWSSTRATLRRTTGRPEATFDCTGVGGTKVGKHYDVVIVDDIVADKAMENARSGSWSIMYETNRWVNQLEPLLSQSARETIGPGFPFIRFIGTRWWAGDTYEHIEESFSGEDARCFTARVKLPDGREETNVTTWEGSRPVLGIYRSGRLAVYRRSAIELGKAAFPEIWPMERIEHWRKQDPELVSCNLLNNPSDAAVRTFQDEWLRYWQYVDASGKSIVYRADDGSRRFVSVDELLKRIVTDPAFTSNSEGSRAAVVVLGTDMTTGKHLVLDVQAYQQDPKDNLEDFLNLCRKWDVRLAYVELAGQQLAYLQWIEAEARRRAIPLALEDVRPGGRQKDVRIEGLMVPFKSAMIYVHPSQSALIDDEYRRWRPGSKRADCLDALAYAIEKAPKPSGTSMGDPRVRAKRQLASYYRRRGLAGVA